MTNYDDLVGFNCRTKKACDFTAEQQHKFLQFLRELNPDERMTDISGFELPDFITEYDVQSILIDADVDDVITVGDFLREHADVLSLAA